MPGVGHCIGADDQGHYWTCDAAEGRLLRFGDPPAYHTTRCGDADEIEPCLPVGPTSDV